MRKRIPEIPSKRARELFERAARGSGKVAIVYHGDADGTSSAALAAAAVERLGGASICRTPAKGENIYTPAFARLVEGDRPELVSVFDTGSRPERPFGDLPTIIIDHHRIDTAPPVEAFVSTFGDDERVSTSALTLDLLAPLAALDDRAWLAAVGLLGDLGDAARDDPIVTRAAAAHGITRLRTVVSLVNAAGRSPAHEVDVALEALRAAETPFEIVRGQGAAAARLHALRDEVGGALARARRVAPKIEGRWAVIEFDEPFRIHGVIAAAWTRRLPDSLVLVANRGYSAGRVHFAVRSHAPIDLRAALRGLVPDAGPDFAAGHDRATGGIVDVATYDRLRRAIREEASSRAA